MLCLTRGIGEQLVIGDDIIIEVVKVRNGKVRFAVSAPKEVSVHRREIYDLIKKERELAELEAIRANQTP